MIKRRGGSQIKNLTPNHKPLKSGVKRGPIAACTVGKNFLRPKIYALSKKTLFENDMSIQSFGTTRVPILGLPLGNPKEK
jgi:hypothetical protein